MSSRAFVYHLPTAVAIESSPGLGGELSAVSLLGVLWKNSIENSRPFGYRTKATLALLWLLKLLHSLDLLRLHRLPVTATARCCRSRRRHHRWRSRGAFALLALCQRTLTKLTKRTTSTVTGHGLMLHWNEYAWPRNG